MDENKDFNRNQTLLEDREPPTLDDNSANYDEEFASDIADDDFNIDEDRNDPEIRNVYGWIGLAFAVVSFFIMPYLFAAVGIILGFVARRGHAGILGNTAIVVSIASIIVRLFLLPLM